MADEELECLISTQIKGADSPQKIIQAISNIFPETDFENEEFTEPEFPLKNDNFEISLSCKNIDEFIEKITNQRILDTSMDAMTLNLRGNKTWFYLSRQAALANKVSFCLKNEEPLGGKLKIQLTKSDLPLWIEDITWHSGREEIPRFIGDDYTMRKDGVAREWFGKN